MGEFLKKVKANMKSDRYAFVRIQLEWMGKDEEVCADRCVETWEKNERKEEVYNYLESMKNKELTKPEQDRFSQKMAEWAEIPGKWNSFRKKRINDYLKQEEIPFRLDSKVVNRKTCWIVKEAKDESENMDG